MGLDKEKKVNDNNRKKSKAVALSYNKEDIAPRVIAKGEGLIADRIIEKSLKENIPQYEDPELVQQLVKLELDDFIPEDLYNAVAEILFYIYRLDGERGRRDD